MEAVLGTAIGTLQPEWYWTRALDARAVGAAALLVAGSVCSGSVRARHREAAAQGRARVAQGGRSWSGSGSGLGRNRETGGWEGE